MINANAEKQPIITAVYTKHNALGPLHFDQSNAINHKQDC